MGANQHTVTEHHEEGHADGMGKKLIWKVFFYLLALTCLEFFIALVLVDNGVNGGGFIKKGLTVNLIYIGLTLIKAYYIVSYFMHLKFERVGFIITTIVVFVFIVYFITLMLTEGHYLQLHLNHQVS